MSLISWSVGKEAAPGGSGREGNAGRPGILLSVPGHGGDNPGQVAWPADGGSDRLDASYVPTMPRYKDMSERSNPEIVWGFLVLPFLTGIAILVALVANAFANSATFTAMDWLGQVVWLGLLGLGMMTALPAAGWQELQRRKGQKEADLKRARAGTAKKPAADDPEDIVP